LPTALPIFAVPLNWAATTAAPPPSGGDIVPAVNRPVAVREPPWIGPVAVTWFVAVMLVTVGSIEAVP